MEATTNTNAKVKMEIQGLALCNFTDGIWKIFFPHVNGHDFKLKVIKKVGNTGKDPAIFILPRTTRINFRINNTPGGGTRNPPDWQDAFDLSSLHTESIHLTTDHSKYAGVLTLAGASLKSQKVRNPEEFEIWEVINNRKNLVGRKTPANVFSSDFQFNAGDSANLTVENDFGFEFTFPFEDQISYEIYLSNDCEGHSCEDILDFKYLYKIIDIDRFQTKRQFELVAFRESHKGFPGSRCGGSAASSIANPDVI
jgi:hypothetical protein